MSNAFRLIQDHHDGHGLNESIILASDEPDGSGAAHRYVASINEVEVASIQFQKGPRNLPESTPGMTEAAVLAVLIDRLRGFQAGPYACAENGTMLIALENALTWTKARADERAARGVLGQNAK